MDAGGNTVTNMRAGAASGEAVEYDQWNNKNASQDAAITTAQSTADTAQATASALTPGTTLRSSGNTALDETFNDITTVSGDVGTSFLLTACGYDDNTTEFRFAQAVVYRASSNLGVYYWYITNLVTDGGAWQLVDTTDTENVTTVRLVPNETGGRAQWQVARLTNG